MARYHAVLYTTSQKLPQTGTENSSNTKHGVEKLPTDSRAKSTPSSTSKRSTASTQVDYGPRAEMEVKPTAGTGFRIQETVPAEKTVNR